MRRWWAVGLTLIGIVLIALLDGRAALTAPEPITNVPNGMRLRVPGSQTGTIVDFNPSIFGPGICAAYGDAFTPLTSPWYGELEGAYTYSITIPADYAHDHVRVELFDPDTHNSDVNRHDVYSLTGLLREYERCANSDRKDSCLLDVPWSGTGANPNPFWFARIDENRGSSTPGQCGTPGSYTESYNTTTVFRLYYYAEQGDGSLQQVDLAYYIGQPNNTDDTDMHWVAPVSPSTPVQELMPAFNDPDEDADDDLRCVFEQLSTIVPLTGFTLPSVPFCEDQEPIALVEDCEAYRASQYAAGLTDATACSPTTNGDFIINLTDEVPGLPLLPDGKRELFLEVRGVAGASENSFGLWAGPARSDDPDRMTVPAQINARQTYVEAARLHGLDLHDSQGVTIDALSYNPINSQNVTISDLAVGYVDASYAGQGIRVTHFDPDSGALPPLLFYFDTIAVDDWSACFGTEANCQTEFGQVSSGPANFVNNGWVNGWEDGGYSFTLPSSDGSVPFPGGMLIARFQSGTGDNFALGLFDLGTAPAAPTNLNATYSTGVVDLTWEDNASTEAAYGVERLAENGDWVVLDDTLPANTETYSDASTRCGRSYAYRVKAQTASGASSWSGIVSVATVCPPNGDPTGLTAAPADAISLTWSDGVTGEAAYTVQRSADGGSSWVTLTDSLAPDSESFTDDTAACGTTYAYRVLATNAGGASAYSNTAGAATPICPPAAPTGLTAAYNGAADAIDLAWDDNASTEDGYTVQRSTDGGLSWATLTDSLPPDSESFTDTTLTCGETYSYRVKAANAGGNSTYSNSDDASSPVCPPDGTPTALTAAYDANTDAIDLTWTDNVSNEDAYTVERSTDGGTTWATLNDALPADAASYTDDPVVCGRMYAYRVTATNASGDSVPSNTASASTPPCSPTLTATYDAGPHHVYLAWTDTSTNETGFIVERQKEGASGWVTLTTAAADATSFTDETATCDQEYVYRITATNAAGDSAPAVSAMVDTSCAIFADLGALPAPFMEPWVEDLFQSGVTTGCADDPLAYCPDEPISRGAMAVFILRALNYPNGYTPQGDPAQIFADVPSPNQPATFELWIEDFFALGITTGCGLDPLRYCPDEPVSRGAMAVFILRALEGRDYTPQGQPGRTFADVPSPNQPPIFEDWVEDFAARGITTGCDAQGNFCPEEPVTRGAMAVFILRAFDAIPDPNDP